MLQKFALIQVILGPKPRLLFFFYFLNFNQIHQMAFAASQSLHNEDPEGEMVGGLCVLYNFGWLREINHGSFPTGLP